MPVRTSVLAVTALLALALAAPASAADDDCPTWFPDFSCDREGRFEGFEKPIVQPYLFEDPFNTTGVYPYYIWHEFPNSSALEGGDLHVAALQARVALTDRIGLIATKDGYGWLRPGSALVGDQDGWFNLGLGAKGVLAQDREAGWAVSGILRFEFPTGSGDVFNGYGDGMVIPSLAAAYALGDARFIADFGSQVPFSSEQSTSLFYHLYAGYNVHPMIQPFVQFSGISWIDDGDGTFGVRLGGLGVTLPLSTVQSVTGTGAFEGADVANIGSQGIDGTNLFTWAVGVAVPITDHVTLAAAYERQFGSHKGIFEQRVTTSVAFEF